MSAGPLSLSAILQVFHWRRNARISQSRATASNDHRELAVFGVSIGQVSGSSTVVTKKKVYFTDSLWFNGQDPVSGRGNATGSGAFNMQSAQAISAAYYFDLAARDNIFADDAVELVIERVPCSAFIQPSQSCELIFCARLDRLRGRKHAGDGGKFRRDLQEQSRHAMNGESVSCRRLIPSGARHLAEAGRRAEIRGATIKIGHQTVMNRVQEGGLAALAPANPIGRKTKQQAITRVLRKLETSLTIPVNRFYFGDNLGWLRNTKEFPDAGVDLVYLDPPFNSKAE